MAIRPHECQSTAGPRRTAAALLAVLVLTLGGAEAAERIRTEVVAVASGDQVTGEIKGLSRAKLTVRSNDLGTVNVDWNEIVTIETARIFEIEVVGGRRLQGTISTPSRGVLLVDAPNGNETLPLSEVANLWPLADGWLGHVEGSFDLGYSYTRGTGVAVGTAGFRLDSRRPNFGQSVSFDGTLTQITETPDSSRYSLFYQYQKYRGEGWMISGLAMAQRNTDLGLNFRGSVGGGVGYRLLVARRQRFWVLGGALVDHEVPIDEEPRENLFALTSASYTLFLTSYPSTSIDTTSALRVGLTDAGRVLFDLSLTAKRELWRDFYISFSLYDTYDSRPPEDTTITNDIGTTLSLGWTF